MRVDVTAEFLVRVQASSAAVASAAQTLGYRTLEVEKLRELIEGKFVDALRTIAADTRPAKNGLGRSIPLSWHKFAR